MKRHSWQSYKGRQERCARRGCKALRQHRSTDSSKNYEYRRPGDDPGWSHPAPPCTGESTSNQAA